MEEKLLENEIAEDGEQTPSSPVDTDPAEEPAVPAEEDSREDVSEEDRDAGSTEEEEVAQTPEAAQNEAALTYSWDLSQEEKKAGEKHSGGRKSAWVFAGILGVIFLLCAGLLVLSFFIGGKGASARSGADAVTISETINPSIVFIKSSSSTGYSTGAGVAFSSDGYIVTNYHIITGSYEIQVTTYDGKTYNAKLVGGSLEDDLAVIHVSDVTLVPASFGNSNRVKTGETAYVIGHPGGEAFAWSISQGIVSGTDRLVITEAGFTVSVIQVDAAVNTGNSGGALINSSCEVIGIVSMRLGAQYENMGFAIPSNYVLSAIDKILSGKNDATEEAAKVNRPYIGIVGTGVEAGKYYIAGSNNKVTVFEEETEGAFYAEVSGVWIVSVSPGGSAYGKLKANDIILKVEDMTVTGIDEVIDILSKHKAGDEVLVTYYSDGETKVAVLTLKESAS